MGKRRRQGSKATQATDGLTDTATAIAVAERHDGEELKLQEKDSSASSLEDASHCLTRAASRPEDFFHPNHQVAQELTGALRQLFAFARRSETQRKPFGPLEELYVDGLDCESIWAELELRNAPLEKHARRTMARLVESEDISLAADVESDDEQANDDEDDEDEDEDSKDGDDNEAGGERKDKDRNIHFSDERARKNVNIHMRQGRLGSDAEEKDVKDVKGLARARRKHNQNQDEDENKDEDMFFDADDMDKFADEGATEDDLDGGVLDEMYGGGEAGGGASSSSENDEEPGLPDDLEDDWDEDEEKDTKMGQMLQDMEDKVGGGISHEDFFGGVSSSRKKKVKNGSLQAKTSGSKNKKSNRDKEEEEEEEKEDALNFMDDEDEDADVAINSAEEDASEKSSEDESLTGHAAYSKQMKGRITEQERELLAEKPWALRGEIQSNDRPENSLLEATVDVDRATRAAPLPTPERAMTLLDMIKKRCLDGNWDDVTPRNIGTPAVRKEVPELSQDKSKEALGELYEKEFLKQTMGVEEGDPQAAVKTELKQLFGKLCNKLDALCNFHYTPKTVIPEMKVQADVAAIAMEEVLPSSVADAEALAPEEIYAKKRGRDAKFLEAEEMNQVDRKRVRSSKKAARRKARRQVETEKKLVSKLNPGLGNKYEKSKMLKDIHSAKNVTTHTGDESAGREFSTSAKFFTQLEEKVKAGVKSVGQENGRADGKGGKGSRAAHYRL